MQRNNTMFEHFRTLYPPRIPLICNHCGVTFLAYPYEAKQGRLFCSRQCRYAANGTIAERFWRKVDKIGDCWPWIGSRSRLGYGVFRLNGRIWKAHRVAWLLTYGSLTPGLDVCHHCNNRGCVNPSHLYEGTHQQNMLDRLDSEHSGWKLDRETVAQIRAAYANGGITQPDLAHEFGISDSHVCHIVNGKHW